MARELEQSKSIPNEAPLELIVGFLQVNFNSHDSFSASLFGHKLN